MTSEQPERDLDKEFESLVANWDATPFGDALPDPESPERPDADAAAESRPGPIPPPGVNVWRGPTMWRPAERAFDEGPSGHLADGPDDEDEEDSFTPAPVHLPPQEDIHFWGIVVGIVGGGLLLLWVALSGAQRSSWWFLAALGLFIGGFTLLILRQPRDRDLGDDGTRV